VRSWVGLRKEVVMKILVLGTAFTSLLFVLGTTNLWACFFMLHVSTDVDVDNGKAWNETTCISQTTKDENRQAQEPMYTYV
jgi:hypothetical protein